MLEERINRINELYHLSQERALTEEEAAEQKELRAEYLAAIRASVKGQLSNIEIVEADGSKHALETISERKKQLREICKDIRAGLSEERKTEAEENLIREFVKLAKILRVDKAFLYASLPNEVKTDNLFTALKKEGVSCYFPQVKKDGMKFFKVKLAEDLLPGFFEVREPIGIPEYTLDPNDLENGDTVLVLVPGLSFDEEGYRIGYGKGYYDAYLNEHASGVNVKTVGVCFNECKLDAIKEWNQAMPKDTNDCKTDLVIFV